MVVGRLQQMLDVSRSLCRLQFPAERIVAQLPGDVFECPQMLPGLIGGGDEEEEEMDRIAIKAVEVDPLLTDRHRSHEPVDAGVLRVRHRHPAPDTGGPQVLALQNRLDDAFEVGSRDPAGLDQCRRHLPDHTLLRRRVDVGADRTRRDEIGKLHAVVSRGDSRSGPARPGGRAVDPWSAHPGNGPGCSEAAPCPVPPGRSSGSHAGIRLFSTTERACGPGSFPCACGAAARAFERRHQRSATDARRPRG